MNTFKPLLAFIGLALFVSCESNESAPFEKMEAIPLVSQQKTISGVFMRYPFRVRLDDSTIYIMDLHGSENYCHKFTYPALKHQASFGKKGDGPHELLKPA